MVRGRFCCLVQPAVRAVRFDSFAGNRRGVAGQGTDPLLLVAIVTTVIGFGFKVAAVPFHLWAPDAYEARPRPRGVHRLRFQGRQFLHSRQILTWVLPAPEGSAVWHGYASGWTPVMPSWCAFNCAGNLTAIIPIERKTPLAISAIAHAGYMLLGAGQHAV